MGGVEASLSKRLKRILGKRGGEGGNWSCIKAIAHQRACALVKTTTRQSVDARWDDNQMLRVWSDDLGNEFCGVEFQSMIALGFVFS